MRLQWEDRALNELEGVIDRAPRGAAEIYEAVGRLAGSSFPSMYRRVEGRPRDHVLTVNPYVVLYRIDGDALKVLRVLDGRRLKMLP